MKKSAKEILEEISRVNHILCTMDNKFDLFKFSLKEIAEIYDLDYPSLNIINLKDAETKFRIIQILRKIKITKYFEIINQIRNKFLHESSKIQESDLYNYACHLNFLRLYFIVENSSLNKLINKEAEELIKKELVCFFLKKPVPIRKLEKLEVFII